MVGALGIPAFRSRLATIDYRNLAGDRLALGSAFFIESAKDLARPDSRLARAIKPKEIATPEGMAAFGSKLSVTSELAQMLGQIMIDNGDWGGLNGNARPFLAKDGSVIAIHFDFDLSTLANSGTSYLELRGLKDRSGRGIAVWLRRQIELDGLNVTEAEFDLAIRGVGRGFASRKNAVFRAVEEAPDVSVERKAVMRSTIQTFFETLLDF